MRAEIRGVLSLMRQRRLINTMLDIIYSTFKLFVYFEKYVLFIGCLGRKSRRDEFKDFRLRTFNTLPAAHIVQYVSLCLNAIYLSLSVPLSYLFRQGDNSKTATFIYYPDSTFYTHLILNIL